MEANTLAGPPIDLNAFRISMRAAGIEDIVEPTLSLFVEESGQLIATLEDALALGDCEAVRRAAHALKGSSGNVRATELATIAATLEAKAEQGDVASAAALLQAASRSRSALVDFLAENGLGQ